MAAPPIIISDTGPTEVPAPYEVPASQAMQLRTVSAVFDGSGASGRFRPCCSIYSQSGALLSRVFPDDILEAGESAEVSFLPFL